MVYVTPCYVILIIVRLIFNISAKREELAEYITSRTDDEKFSWFQVYQILEIRNILNLDRISKDIKIKNMEYVKTTADVLEHKKTVYTKLDNKGKEITHTTYNLKIKYYARDRSYAIWMDSSYLDNSIDVYYNLKNPTEVVHIENFKKGINGEVSFLKFIFGIISKVLLLIVLLWYILKWIIK